MKRLVALGFAAACVCFTSSFAHAQRVTAMKTSHFAAMCHAQKGHPMCDAYLSGITDGVSVGGINAVNRGDKNVPRPFCVEKSATMAQLRQHFLQWADNNRNLLDKPVGEGVFLALHAAYPCR